jgi:folate-binding protein YgfZ
MSERSETMLRESLLLDAHKELGGQMETAFGWKMAARYRNPLDEHRQVRGGVGLIDLCFHGAVRIGGKEGAQFLNGLVTNDVKGLADGKGIKAAFLTGHGKVKALCRVLRLGDEYLVINDPQTHDSVYKYVFPFSYAGDFKVADVSEEYRILSVQGPLAQQVMKEICFEPVPEMVELEWRSTLVAGHRVIVVRGTRTGETGYDILAPAAGLRDIWDFVLIKGSFHSISPFGLDALNSLRIEAGIPVYGIDVDETNMMLETGLADAVSLTKGCYTGQEAVAMATYRGHVSKKLSGLAVAGGRVPSKGDRVSKEGKDIGYVTSALQSDTLGGIIALAYVKHGFFDVGNQVTVGTDEGTQPAVIVEVPFYQNLTTNN